MRRTASRGRQPGPLLDPGPAAVGRSKEALHAEPGEPPSRSSPFGRQMLGLERLWRVEQRPRAAAIEADEQLLAAAQPNVVMRDADAAAFARQLPNKPRVGVVLAQREDVRAVASQTDNRDETALGRERRDAERHATAPPAATPVCGHVQPARRTGLAHRPEAGVWQRVGVKTICDRD